ncbi:hypothetical protein [Pseudonocardia sp.]|uniref:hypothetical protein n=1 Tax=Pseudonocardia sp. TaxID=60912 RepID=UPI003D137917
MGEVDVLRVTVSGGGPVGLAFALTLEHLLGSRVAITVHDTRWVRDGCGVRWRTVAEGNARRRQVVTVQSRQFRALPPAVCEHLFTPGAWSEMWPAGADSVDGLRPRNVRIAHVEDRLLELAHAASRIRLVPGEFDPATTSGSHVLAICEGARSATREHFADRFGAADPAPYSLRGEQVRDVVLGLRVRSRLPDPAAVLLTVAQNRFLLNTVDGDGYLNMRLTRAEARELVAVDPVRRVLAPCLRHTPCVLERAGGDRFRCDVHGALLLPALVAGSALWARVRDGLRLFDIAEDDVGAATGFRLDMAARSRFSAELLPGTYGFLLGDAANAIHFWPGRGLNSGWASAVSLARCLARGRAAARPGTPLRDADLTRHEAVMAMLQYRHKSRAWRQMVAPDARGETHQIRDVIADGLAAAATADRSADLTALVARAAAIRDRLAARLPGAPGDAELRAHLDRLATATLHTLRRSGAWDTAGTAGEEVDVAWVLPDPDPAPSAGEPAGVAA